MPALAPFRDSYDSAASIRAAHTGKPMDAGLWWTAEVKHDEIMAASYLMADKIQASGHPAYLAATAQMVNHVTGEVIECARFRGINLIPYVANKLRAEMSAVVDGYRSSPASKLTPRIRYYVWSTGSPIMPGEPLRQRHLDSTRAITKFFVKARKNYGIEILFRATEIKLNESTHAVNLHHNLVYCPHKRLPPAKWRQFLSELRKATGGGGKDNGEIVDMAHVVRYSMKPIAGIEKAPVDVIGWIVREMDRAKMSAKYNSLAAFANEHAGETYTSETLSGKKDWKNKPKRGRRVKVEHDGETAGDAKPPARKVECLRVGTARTSWRRNLWSQAASIFKGFTWNPETPDGIRAMEAFEAIRAADISASMSNGAPSPEVQRTISAAVRATASPEEAANTYDVLCSTLFVQPSIQSNRPAIDKLPSLPVIDNDNNIIPFPSPRPRWIDGVQMHPKTGKPMVQTEIYYPTVEPIAPTPANDDYDYSEMDVENQLMDEIEAKIILEEIREAFGRTPAGRLHHHLMNLWVEIRPHFHIATGDIEQRFIKYRAGLYAKSPQIDEFVPDYAVIYSYPGLKRYVPDLSAAA